MTAEIKKFIEILSETRKNYDTISRAFLEENYCNGIIQGLDIAIAELAFKYI